MISFIVPAHNEQAGIGRTLSAIHDAARSVGRPYEIIVVDDASTVATAEIARQRVQSGRRVFRGGRKSRAGETRGHGLLPGSPTRNSTAFLRTTSALTMCIQPWSRSMTYSNCQFCQPRRLASCSATIEAARFT